MNLNRRTHADWTVFLMPLWTLWLGIVIWRRMEGSNYVLEPAVAG